LRQFQMITSENSILIDSIRKEDKRALLEIYKSFFPKVRHLIQLNSGNVFDAEDVFQDALVIIYLKIRNNSLNLCCPFGSYLISIAKFLWLKELRRKRTYFGIEVENALALPDCCDFLDDYIKMEKRKLIMDHFQDMNSECKKILELYYNETPVTRITSLMGYTNDQYTRNRRTFCKGKLVRAIWNNPRYRELKNEAYPQDTRVPKW